MAIPTRRAQIERVAEFLNDPENDERSVDDVAKIIVDSMYTMWTRNETSPPIPLKEGLAFKAPNVAKIYHVGWIGPMWWGAKKGVLSTAWIIESGSSYGTLMPVEDPFWRIVTPSNAKSGGPGNNKDGWKPGDRVSHSRGAHHYEILAVGDKTVLMRSIKDAERIFVDSNADLTMYYRKER